jgi:hypothetical protein
MIDDLLFSPLLTRVLCGPKQFRFSGSVVARINRSELGDDDALILGNLLIGQAGGQVIVPDFGFYGHPLHASLIRQNRLTAGVGYLAELGRPDAPLRQAFLTIKDRHGSGCLFDDAQTLAGYAGLLPGTTAYSDFVQRTMEQS